MLEHFLLANWYWVVAAVLSGGALLFLMFQEGHYHFSVSPSEAVLMFNHHHAVFFDVRSLEDYGRGTIQHAQRVPEKEHLLKEIGHLKGRSAIVFCRSGRESITLVAQLRRQGIETVFALQGGFQMWVNASLPVTRTSLISKKEES